MIGIAALSMVLITAGCASGTSGGSEQPVLEKVDPAVFEQQLQAAEEQTDPGADQNVEDTIAAALGDTSAAAAGTQTAGTSAFDEELSGTHQRRFAPEKSDFEQKLEQAAPAPAAEDPS